MFTGTQLWYTVCVNSGVSLCGKSLLLWRQWIRSPLVPCHDLVFAKIPGWFCVVWAHYCGASGLEVHWHPFMVFVWIPGWFCVVRAHYCGASGLEVGRGPGLNPSISICLVNSTIDRDSDFSLLHIILYNLQWNTQWWYCCLSQWTFKGTRASKYQYYMGY